MALAVRGAKQRALLALLALHRGEPVSADRLIDVLWGDGQAANPANALQAQIGQLRRTLGAGAIVTTEAGYPLPVTGNPGAGWSSWLTRRRWAAAGAAVAVLALCSAGTIVMLHQPAGKAPARWPTAV